MVIPTGCRKINIKFKNLTCTVSKFGWLVCIASQSDWVIMSSVQKITCNKEYRNTNRDQRHANPYLLVSSRLCWTRILIVSYFILLSWHKHNSNYDGNHKMLLLEWKAWKNISTKTHLWNPCILILKIMKHSLNDLYFSLFLPCQIK